MTENSPSLGEAIEAAIYGWFEKNPGMPMAFVAAVDWIDGEDGAGTLSIRTFDGQPTHRSMGIVRYLDSWFADDAQNEMTMAAYAAGEEEDADE